MAYAIKYRIQYKRISNSTTTIDILQDGYTGGTITELDGVDNPLEISFEGNVNNIYTPTLGSGASIKILTTPLTLLDLFTENLQKFVIKIYNGNSGSNLIWQGFINSEIYSEDYSASSLTPITLYANDGMAVLDTIPYYNTTGSTYYTGTTNLSTIFGNILNKINISFDKLYYVTDYRIADYSRNIFLHLSIPQENFIDESGVPMSCRQVLDSIASGLGMVIKFKGSTIYMYDPIDLNDVSVGHEYGTTPVGYDADVAADFGGVLDLSASTFNWFETGAKLDIVPAYNEVQVKYNPYNFSEYIYDFNNVDNWLVEGSFSLHNQSTGNYYRNVDVVYDGWNNGGVLYPIVGGNYAAIKETENNAPIYFIFLNMEHNYINYTFPFSNVTMDNNLSIKLSFDAYVQTRANTYNIFASGDSHQINWVKIPYTIKVGDKYYKSSTNSWSTGFTPTTDYNPFLLIEEGTTWQTVLESNISDKWTNYSIIVPFSPNSSSTDYDELLQGNIFIEFYDNLTSYFVSQSYPTTYLYYVLIKNVKVEVIDSRSGKQTGNDGINTKVTISPNLTGKSPLEIKTSTGIGTYGNSRAAFKTDMQTNIGMNASGLIRSTAETGGTAYNTSKLILQSVISQYKQPRFKLSGSLDVKNYLTDIDLYLIKDSNYMGSRKFYIVSGTYEDYYEKYNAEMLELVSSRDSIE